MSNLTVLLRLRCGNQGNWPDRGLNWLSGTFKRGRNPPLLDRPVERGPYARRRARRYQGSEGIILLTDGHVATQAPGGGACRAVARCGQRGASVRKMHRRRRAAEALIRRWRTQYPDAQLIARRPADYPSRSGNRKALAGGAFFRASGRGAADRYVPAPFTAALHGSNPTAARSKSSETATARRELPRSRPARPPQPSPSR